MAAGRWQGAKLYSLIRKEMLVRLAVAGKHLQTETRSNVSIPVRRVRRRRRRDTSRGPKGSTYYLVDPASRSRPGEFPRKESGRLRRGIRYRLSRREMVATISVTGGNPRNGFRYPLHHERDLRPFLSRTFYIQRKTITKILMRPPIT